MTPPSSRHYLAWTCPQIPERNAFTMEPTPAATVEAPPHAPAGPQWVAFRCAGQRCAVPLEQVRAILTPAPYTRIPGTGREVCGLAGVRGRIITVLDLGVLLGGTPAADTPDHRLLLIERSGRVVGMAVEEVLAVSHAEAEPDRAGGDVRGVDGADRIGTCRIGGERYLGLRLDRIAGRVMD